MRLLTGENGPGFCKLSKSRIDRDENGRENVGRLGASAGAGWGACWPGTVLGWLFGGGIVYTVGGVFYALKFPRIQTKYFGFHELFHIFILLGSTCFYVLIFCYIH